MNNLFHFKSIIDFFEIVLIHKNRIHFGINSF
jgi:hypothetical protein